MKILMAKDHAQERNKQFYAKTKVNAFAPIIICSMSFAEGTLTVLTRASLFSE